MMQSTDNLLDWFTNEFQACAKVGYRQRAFAHNSFPLDVCDHSSAVNFQTEREYEIKLAEPELRYILQCVWDYQQQQTACQKYSSVNDAYHNFLTILHLTSDSSIYHMD